MINKADLVSIISKYHLNGLNEAVKWEIKDKKLTIKFTTSNNTMIGTVTYDGIELEDSIIGISSTSQLNKLIGITNGYLKLEYVKQHKIIPKPGEYIGDGVYNITADLDNESINAIVKAKSSLADSDTVVFKPFTNDDGDLQLEMQFGGNIEYSNKVSFYLPNIQTNNLPHNFQSHYYSDTIKEIMYCNKDVVGGKMSINLDGVMKLEFDNGNLKSEYYIIQKEN